MKRSDALKIISELVLKDKKTILISSTGIIGREAFKILKNKKHFYMAGSMGLASSIGLGIAITNKKVKIVIVEGDGSCLMNLQSMVTISSLKPKNIIHIVLDNGVYESTGGFQTYSSNINISKIADTLGYRQVLLIENKESLISAIKRSLKNLNGPYFFHVKIEKTEKNGILPRPKRLFIMTKNIKNFVVKINEKRK